MAEINTTTPATQPQGAAYAELPNERRAFEAWYVSETRKNLPNLGEKWSDEEVRDAFMGPSDEGTYRASSAMTAWVAWQARASHWQAIAGPDGIDGRLETWLTYGAGELHPHTKNLVVRFARALACKLLAAEQKYGYSDGWTSPDWMDRCRKHLLEHVAKGDARDVAAYCAFLWYHGETTATEPMNWPLPCDVTVGHGTIRKGVALRTLINRMKVLYEMATGNNADEVATRTPEQRAALLEAFQARVQATVVQPAAPSTPSASTPCEFPAMTSELASILGTMCFQCITFAQVLRAAGHQIEKRAEDEQAAVLHWMLGHYFRHGDGGWRKSAAEDMERMHAAARATKGGA